MKKTVFIPIVTIAGTLAAATPLVALTSCAQEQYKIGVCTDGDLGVPVTTDHAKVEKNKGITFNLIFAPGGVYSVTRITCNDKDIAKNKYSVIDRTITINENVINGDIEVHVKFTQAPVLTTYHSTVAGGLVSDGIITADPNKNLDVIYTKTEGSQVDKIYVDVAVNDVLLPSDGFSVTDVDNGFKVTIFKQNITGQIEIKIAGYYDIETSAKLSTGEAFDKDKYEFTEEHCSPLKQLAGVFTFKDEDTHNGLALSIINATTEKPITYGYEVIKDKTDAKVWHVNLATDIVSSNLKFIFTVDPE